jgi:chaperonin GroES
MKKQKKPLSKTKKALPKRKTSPTNSAKKKPGVDIKNKAGITPLGERVLVKPLALETTTLSGILIPDNSKEKPEQGIVVAVGPGKKNEAGHAVPLSVKVGDKVMFSKYGFDEIKVNGVEYYMVAESSILAILD